MEDTPIPRNSSGQYTLPPGDAAVSAGPISSLAYNGQNSDFAGELTNSLDRLGRGAMEANFPMGANRIVGMADPIAATDAATKEYVDNPSTVPATVTAAIAAADAAMKEYVDNPSTVPATVTAAIAAAVAVAVAENFPIFTGMVILIAATYLPSGYLACNGALVSRTTYAALFAVIGVHFGAGDGSTTFELPNYVAFDPSGYFAGYIKT